MTKYRTMILSFGVMLAFWAFLFHSLALATTFIVLLTVHEFGHYLVARKLGMNVSLPIFTPIGALINMREMPRDACQEALMAYGGPLAGTLASVLALGVGTAVGSHAIVLGAQYGFFLNLFNLVPLSPLDGGRISMAIDRRMWVLGALLMAGYLFLQLASGIIDPFTLIIFFLIGRFAVEDVRMRRAQAEHMPQYFAIGTPRRLAFAAAYIGLIGFLLFMLAVL